MWVIYRPFITHVCDMRGMVMERFANNSCKYWFCYRNLHHVPWRSSSSSCCTMATSLLLLLLITFIPIVAAAEPYQFPDSNENDSLFSYSNDVGYFTLTGSTIRSCNNGSLLQALSSQDRLYGRPAAVPCYLARQVVEDKTEAFSCRISSPICYLQYP